MNDQYICIIADKNSFVVILKRTDHINKLETMINEGIQLGACAECWDTAVLIRSKITITFL